ncbi:hypothetical protein [Methylobacterium sp. 17Sr1-1]|uniref:hypothetical protein n=1 Tax=Methylobacterium sp. 17Sr1-1 TaxID=2202826 RepID=UPI000D70203F|nr:hypothetical protein [Methylobacterium sp. 17Sr1-1]AWN51691.1 hypothetical protein DK412_08325 [Methylobacterium sp. 17Sr1-1]
MRPKSDRSAEIRAQKRIARQYRSLGYDVVERPEPRQLPDFMRDTAPDLVAHSATDNVVVEIKRHATLKGSNDLVGLAERVSGRPDWRFELIVLADEDGPPPSDHGPLIAKARAAAEAGLLDVACLSLLPILAAILRGVARAYGVRLADAPARRLVEELSFRGVLPEPLVDQCLAALAVGDRLTQDGSGSEPPSRVEFEALAQACDTLRHLA